MDLEGVKNISRFRGGVPKKEIPFDVVYFSGHFGKIWVGDAYGMENLGFVTKQQTIFDYGSLLYTILIKKIQNLLIQ